ncbi:MAG: ABC transporter permease, partial [Pseudorhodoplanes sp.]
MLVYSVKRIALALAVGVFVSALSFFLLYAAGDPATAILGPSATQVDIDNVRRLYGFDRPIV